MPDNYWWLLKRFTVARWLPTRNYQIPRSIISLSSVFNLHPQFPFLSRYRFCMSACLDLSLGLVRKWRGGVVWCYFISRHNFTNLSNLMWTLVEPTYKGHKGVFIALINYEPQCKSCLCCVCLPEASQASFINAHLFACKTISNQ